jgi:hypothetical protein
VLLGSFVLLAPQEVSVKSAKKGQTVEIWVVARVNEKTDNETYFEDKEIK